MGTATVQILDEPGRIFPGSAYDVDGFAGGEPPFHPDTDKKPPEEKDQHRTDGVNRHEEKHIAGIRAEKRGVALKCDGGRGCRKDAAH